MSGKLPRPQWADWLFRGFGIRLEAVGSKSLGDTMRTHFMDNQNGCVFCLAAVFVSTIKRPKYMFIYTWHSN